MPLKLHTNRPIKRNRRFAVESTADITGLPAYNKSKVSLTDKQARNWRAMRDEFYFRSNVKTKSALCTMLVIHALTRVDQECETIKSADLTPFLNKEYPMVVWDPVSVGKILGAIVKAAELVMHPEINWPEHYGIPVEKYRNGTSAHYALRPIFWTTAWLNAMMDELRPEAEKERDNPGYFATKGSWAATAGADPAFNAGLAVQSKMRQQKMADDALARAYPESYVWARSEVRYK